MRVLGVPHRVGLPEEACLQDDAHSDVNYVKIGDGEIGEHCVS